MRMASSESSVRHHSAHPPASSSARRRITHIVPTVRAAPRSFSERIVVRKKKAYSQAHMRW